MIRVGTIRTFALALLLAAGTASSGAAQTALIPHWRTRLVVWQKHSGEARPWRQDPRLAPYTSPHVPDDFQVRFANPDSAGGGRHEYMWVRVIDVDSVTGQYLGFLLNQPHWLTSVVAGDNVVFHQPVGDAHPVAVGAPRYGEAGWPANDTSAFAATLGEGIRAYRAGNNGHHMPGIERCIAVLGPAMESAPPAASVDERFVGHFLLGRCLAEKYETERAIAQFRAAIALRPDDVDAHMALLAELSLTVHPRTDKPEYGSARWEREFLAELDIVRARFLGDSDVARILSAIFHPSHEAELDAESRKQVERLRRVGFAFFRWKRR